MCRNNIHSYCISYCIIYECVWSTYDVSSLVQPHDFLHIPAKHQDTSNFSTDTRPPIESLRKLIYVYIYIIRNTYMCSKRGILQQTAKTSWTPYIGQTNMILNTYSKAKVPMTTLVSLKVWWILNNVYFALVLSVHFSKWNACVYSICVLFFYNCDMTHPLCNLMPNTTMKHTSPSTLFLVLLCKSYGYIHTV